MTGLLAAELPQGAPESGPWMQFSAAAQAVLAGECLGAAAQHAGLLLRVCCVVPGSLYTHRCEARKRE